MSDKKLTEEISTVRVTEEMKQRASDSDMSESDYVRQRWLAGESAIAELDPRVGEAAGNESQIKIDSAEAAAKQLDDGALLSKLSEEKQSYSDILESLTQEFESVLADQLLELARSDQSAVETDGRGNYFLE